MDPQRWNRIKEIFDAACEVPPDARAAFLERACGDDVAMREEIQGLFDEEDRVHSMLDGVAIEATGLLGDLTREGRRIGPYLLIRRIGVGGMGEVYLAARADGQFEHRVALKLVRPGLGSEQILARFRSERQILARLQHPNIARLLDGGLTEEGQPYFVLEYIDGQPIDAYADAHQLSIDERLDLFGQVCRAVTYAHANLVVHRDLKPSNILVTADGQVKLLDFGIARMVSEDETAEPLTRTGGGVMTPAYASPEQARGEPVNVSTDIYSLGVVLYELLTGLRPYDVDSRNPIEAARVICGVAPERPSTAVTEAGDAAATSETIGKARGMEVGRLRRRLSGDLDVICLKALRKETERRYASAHEMGEDIRRHLGGRPIRARAESVSYRLGKFVRRNRVVVGMAAAMVAGLLLIAALYTVRLAEENDRVLREAEKANAVVGFLESLFRTSDPAVSKGETVTARELLDAGADRIETELAGQPEVQARMMRVLGNVYASLSLLDRAEPLLEQALQRDQSLYGSQSPDAAESMAGLAFVALEHGRYPEAESLFRQTLDIRRAALGPAHPETIETMNLLGSAYWRQDDYEAADSLYRAALALGKAALGPESPQVAKSTGALALVMKYKGDYEAADPLYQEALALERKIYGDVHPNVAITMGNYAVLKKDAGDLDGAEALQREALALNRQLYGEEHSVLAASMYNLGLTLWLKAEYDEAEALYREALAMHRALLGDEHYRIARGYNDIGLLLQDKGDYEAAETAFREAGRLAGDLLGPEHRITAIYTDNLARLLNARGRRDEAERLHREALAVFLKLLGPEHPSVGICMNNLARTLRDKGDLDAAEAQFREALAVHRKALRPGHRNIANPLLGLGSVLQRRGAHDEAEALFREALEIRRAGFDEGHWLTAVAASALGGELTLLGRYAEAEPLLVGAYETLATKRGAGDRITEETRHRLVDLYASWGKPDEEARYRSAVAEGAASGS